MAKFYPKMSHLPQESFQITLMVPLFVKKCDFSIEFKLNCINKAKKIHRGVLIDRVYYYAILAEEWRTIQ